MLHVKTTENATVCRRHVTQASSISRFTLLSTHSFRPLKREHLGETKGTSLPSLPLLSQDEGLARRQPWRGCGSHLLPSASFTSRATAKEDACSARPGRPPRRDGMGRDGAGRGGAPLPLTCPAVVELQGALDAEGLLAGAAAEPVLAVHLAGGGHQRGWPSPWGRPSAGVAGSLGAVLAAPTWAWFTCFSTTLPLGLGTVTFHSCRPGAQEKALTQQRRCPRRLPPPCQRPARHRGRRAVSCPLPAPVAAAPPLACGSHLVPAVLVGNVLLQTLLAAEQLRTLLALEQLVAWEAGRGRTQHRRGSRGRGAGAGRGRDSPCERTCLLRLLLFWKTLLQTLHWCTRRWSPSCRSFRRTPWRPDSTRLLLRARLPPW